MPNIKSAKKRVKVIATKTARNKATKSALRTAVKKAYYAVDTNADNKTEAVRLAIKKIDQATARVFFTRTLQQEANHHLLKDLTHQHKCNKSYRLKSREYSLLFYFVLLTFL